MKPPPSDSSAAFEWNRNASGNAALSVPEPQSHAATYVPLDDFLQVEVLDKEKIRSTVKAFLIEHQAKGKLLLMLASRGKLIADLGVMGKKRFTFGEVVKQVDAALQKSESTSVRNIDPRELARLVCVPAVDGR